MFALGLVLAISMAAVAGANAGPGPSSRSTNELLRQSADRVAELSAAAERNRLARDIHDSLGHHLTAIARPAGEGEAFRDRDAGAADSARGRRPRSARQALDDVRHSVRALRDEPVRSRSRPRSATWPGTPTTAGWRSPWMVTATSGRTTRPRSPRCTGPPRRG